MNNLKYLEKIKDNNNNIDFEQIQEYDLKYRRVKALEIIAEELCELNLTANVLSSVIEAVTNQGNSINVNARVARI